MNNTNFDQAAWEAFQEAAAEKYDFSTCMRPDGSKYGSRGRCIKGSETSPASKDDKKSGSKSSSGGGGVSDAQAAALSKDLTRQIGEAAKKGDKKAVDNLMLAKSTVDGQIKARAAASGKGGAAEQLRQINTQEGRGGGVGKSGRSSVGKKGVISSKEKAAMSKNVKSLDKKAKGLDKKAEAADKKWRKGGMKDKALQKEVRSLDRQAKAANKEAEKADKAFQKAIKK